MPAENINKIYIAKNLTPWMVDEIIALSKLTAFTLVLLRKPDNTYVEDINKIQTNGIKVITDPWRKKFSMSDILFAVKFIAKRSGCFVGQKNIVFGIKTIIWFIRLDKTIFNNGNLHAQFATQAAIIAIMLKRFFNNTIKVSFTIHAYDIFFRNRWLPILVEKSDACFSISQFNISYLATKYKIKSSKIILSRLGSEKIHPNKEKKINGIILKVGFLSWWGEKKGVKYLFDSVSTCKKEKLPVKFILAGDGYLRRKYLKKAVDHEFEDYIEYRGIIKGKNKDFFFKDIDVFVLPSIKIKDDMDGIPVVLMEAIAHGLPLISTKVSGIPEICINNYNGFLIQQRDSNAIVTAIKAILHNKDLLKKFSENSLEICKSYDLNENTRRKAMIMNWL